ncbi:MAG TPA: type II secretion system F family protein [Ramlibacter sp.]|jgi:type II secretory pathway component PulF|nr:type II secretion system F family protein [Ramlibacter sp.]
MNAQALTRTWARWQFRGDSRTRQALWRKLAKLLGDGIPIIAGLQELRALRDPSSPMAFAIGEWIRGMNNGRKLSEVTGPWVSVEERMLILAGEQAGTLPQALHSVVQVQRAAAAVRRAVVAGLAYPAFLLALAVASLYFFGYKIIPAFSRVAGEDGWTGLARTMVGTAAFVQHWMHWLVLALALLLAGFFVSLPRWNSPLRTWLDRHPPFSIYRVMQGASWLIALSALVAAGMRIETAIEQLGRRGSAWARVRCDAALKGLRAGRNLGESLARSGYEFPDRLIIADLRLYASKAGFDEALRVIGEEWISESVERVQALMRVLFALALLLVGAVVMFIAAGFGAMQMQLMEIVQRPPA